MISLLSHCCPCHYGVMHGVVGCWAPVIVLASCDSLSSLQVSAGIGGKLANVIKECATNTSLLFTGAGQQKRQLLIMDECDGMSGERIVCKSCCHVRYDNTYRWQLRVECVGLERVSAGLRRSCGGVLLWQQCFAGCAQHLVKYTMY